MVAFFEYIVIIDQQQYFFVVNYVLTSLSGHIENQNSKFQVYLLEKLYARLSPIA